MAGHPAEDLAEALRSAGAAAGLDAVGITDAAPFDAERAILESRRADGLAADMAFTYRNPARSTDPQRILDGAASIVVGALGYGRAAGEVGERDPTRPTGRVARYAWSDHYRALRDGLEAMASVLRVGGHAARVVADDNALLDRAAAVRAGLGWYGKNANVLLPGRGSWFVLGSVVTDAVLPVDPPATGGCGSCARCLPACPTGALVAPGVLDARRCLAWLVQAPGVFPVEHRAALGDRIYGCDDCQDVCPPNRLPAKAAGRLDDGEATVDLLWVLGADDDELLDRLGRWYIPHRDPRYLRRNALVALGNSGIGDDDAVEDALRRHLAFGDAMIQAHAVWAAARLGRHDLLHLVGDDPDPLVVAEMEAAAR